jgi:dihydroorotase
MTAGAQMHEGAVSTRLGLKGWPREAEDIIVARDILLNERIRARYHVAHLSTKGAARLVREAKSRGIPVTAEVTPHHLTLTDRELIGYRTFCKVTPPLREEEDVEAVREALRDGTLDCIATDHAPHSSLEKDCELAAASPGMIGLETTIPVLLGLVRDGHLSAKRLVEVLTSAPAKIGGIEGGSLGVGDRADITLLAPEKRWTVDASTIASKQVNSPWHGKEMLGGCAATLVAGEVVYEG